MVKKYWPEVTLLLVTFVGVMIFALGSDAIIRLTPLYLLLTTALLYYRVRRSYKIIEAWTVAACVGFAAELLGVHTGLLFGEYSYGSVLGVTFGGVPLLVGVLWALVTSVLWSLLPETLGLRRVPIVGILAVVYDITLEHFATRFGLWSWDGSIPLSNALGWFIVACAIACIFHVRRYVIDRSLLSTIILPLQTVFFALLLVL
jgi:bisanhydrobacterioruberin hydratase